MSGGVPKPPPPQPGEFNEKNGGDTAWGRWEQTQEEVHGYVTVPENTRARELQVKFTTTSIKVSLKGSELMGGTLCAAVVADDCYWEMVDGVLMLVLAKVVKAKACGRENPE
eukprot:gene1943-7961_t